MAVRIHTWIAAGALALAALPPVSAQGLRWVRTPGLGAIGAFTGVVTPFGYVPATIPTHWVVPQYVIHYEAPQPIYVPAAVPAGPAVRPVQIAALPLGGAAATGEIRVKAGSVVMWTNDADRSRTLVVDLSGRADSRDRATLQTWQVRPKDRFSLVFRQPGAYDAYLQEDPERHARIIVEE